MVVNWGGVGILTFLYHLLIKLKFALYYEIPAVRSIAIIAILA